MILDKALQELKFWRIHLVQLNFRPFVCPPPSVVGWVDASSYAAGGIACVLKDNAVGQYRPLTADNLLIPVTGNTGLAAVKDCATWQVASVAKSLEQPHVRDEYDLDPDLIKETTFSHKMFDRREMLADSNERELIAARELIIGSLRILENSVFTIHTDNLNSAIILSKGSPKPRLQKYALEIDNICMQYNFTIQPVGIPRSLNNFSDKISKCLDIEDYGVTDKFYGEVSTIFKVNCNFDRFANNTNTKTVLFNSASFCVGTSGVDSFCYDWGLDSINWLFPPPRLVVKAINHLKLCNAMGLLVAPIWKSAEFYAYLQNPSIEKKIVRKVVFSGKNIFHYGSDKSSYFGPDFNSAVGVWLLDFRK